MLLEISQNSQENTCDKVSFLMKLQAEAPASDLSRVFSYWRFLVYFISTEKWNEKWEIPGRRLNIHFFVREIKYSLIFLTSKISKEILQMVIWSENVFKGNLMSQFSWLEEFCWGNVSGWWSLGELQYENGLNDKLQTLHTHF